MSFNFMAESPPAVILEPPKVKSVTVSIATSVICHEVMGPEAMILLLDAFELWCWRRLLRVPWIARRLNQLILKEMSPEY